MKVRVSSGAHGCNREALPDTGRESVSTMKADSHAEMHEGPDAWSRFQKAMKAVVSVPKSKVLQPKRKRTLKKSKGK